MSKEVTLQPVTQKPKARDLTRWMYLLQRGLLCGECEGGKKVMRHLCLSCLGTGIPPIPWSELR